jgi:dynein light chain Tctex-type 1
MAKNNDEDLDEVIGLSQDETDKIQQFMNEYFQGKLFDDTESDAIVEESLEELMKVLNNFKKPYKYVVDCMISQRVGAGMTNYTSAVYDKNADNIYHFYYPQQVKEKSLIFVLVTIFVISFSNAS